MQPSTTAGSSSSSSSSRGGGGGLSRGGLARFRSAPVTWLEALLEDDEEGEENDDALNKNDCLTQLLVGNSVAPAAITRRNSVSFHSTPDPVLFDSGSAGLLRQNSSSAEFLGNSGIGSDLYFSNFGSPTNYDYMGSNTYGSSTGKRPREVESQQISQNYPAQLKQEQSNQVPGGGSSLLDMDIEKLLEDSVQCRVRAKRGCATHPRSIAERVRRTRISDRIRKLQELVPDMDKQTNTADMLDEAVEYVKLLQRQIQELSEHQKKCKCVPRN